MSLFGISEKKEIERLKAQLSPDQRQLDELAKQVQAARAELKQLQSQVREARQQLIETDENALLQSFGIYTPHYSYATSDEYREKLKDIRDKQKIAIKKRLGCSGKRKLAGQRKLREGQENGPRHAEAPSQGL